MNDAIDPPQDDFDLFRQNVGTVRRIQHNSVISQRAKPEPRPKQREADEQLALDEMAHGLSDHEYLETGEELYFKRAGIQNRLFLKLKRGQIRIDCELDLHGLIVTEAKQQLSRFLVNSKTTNTRCVRIVHGKGKGSRGGIPVIKRKLNHWLQQRDEVLAFCSARHVDGGTGAVYVLLKNNRM